MLYTDFMNNLTSRRRNPNSLSLKIGAWFEARATGWGLVALPLVLAVLLTIVLLRWSIG
jgi:hypothetical protein